MINLLPTDVKETIAYARRNSLLRKWTVALCLAIIGILGIIGAGHLYLQQATKSYAQQVEQGQANLKAQKLDETQTEVQSITDTLKLAVQVLSREILFSKLLRQIGAALPNGSVLTELSINKVEGGIDLQVAAASYQTATQVQINLQDPKNQIFEKADIINIQCSSPTEASGNQFVAQYPCTVQIRALFAKNNSFSFSGGASEVKP